MKKILLILSVFYTSAIFSQPDVKEITKLSDSLSTSTPFQINFQQDAAQLDSIFYSNVGKQYFNFNATTLDNETITEKSLLGKVSFIYFWFQGCSPCIAEFEDLNKLYTKYVNNSNFQFISFTKDEPEYAHKTKLKYDLLFPICPISWDECSRLNLHSGFPVIIITDKQGKIFYLKHGGYVDKEKVKKQIQLFEQKITEALSL